MRSKDRRLAVLASEINVIEITEFLMSAEQWGFAIALLAIAFLGYGLVFTIWSILSAITARVAKPTNNGVKSAAVWVVWTWCLMTILIMGFLHNQVSTWLMLFFVPASILATIGGACYGNSREQED